MADKKQEEKQEKAKQKCSKCGTGYGYKRIKDGSWICGSCGNVDPGEK